MPAYIKRQVIGRNYKRWRLRTILKQTWISAFDTGNVVYAISVGLPKIYHFHAKDNYLYYLLTDNASFQASVKKIKKKLLVKS